MMMICRVVVVAAALSDAATAAAVAAAASAAAAVIVSAAVVFSKNIHFLFVSTSHTVIISQALSICSVFIWLVLYIFACSRQILQFGGFFPAGQTWR